MFSSNSLFDGEGDGEDEECGEEVFHLAAGFTCFPRCETPFPSGGEARLS